MNWKTLPTPPRLATVLSVALLVGASAAAQVRNAPVVPTTGCGSGTSNPNIPSLEVRVVMSVGQPVKSEQIRVQVTSESGVPVAQAFTNARGGLALFYNLTVCSFSLKVSGPGIETTSTGILQLINSSSNESGVCHRQTQARKFRNSCPAGERRPGDPRGCQKCLRGGQRSLRQRSCGQSPGNCRGWPSRR